MHIETTRQLRLTTAEGTLPNAVDIHAGTRAEVPDAVGRRMIEAGEAKEVSAPTKTVAEGVKPAVGTHGRPGSVVETGDEHAEHLVEVGHAHGKKKGAKE